MAHSKTVTCVKMLTTANVVYFYSAFNYHIWYQLLQWQINAASRTTSNPCSRHRSSITPKPYLFLLKSCNNIIDQLQWSTKAAIKVCILFSCCWTERHTFNTKHMHQSRLIPSQTEPCVFIKKSPRQLKQFKSAVQNLPLHWWGTIRFRWLFYTSHVKTNCPACV